MTLFFSSHEIIVHRLREISSNKHSYSATGTVHPADIQPETDERVEMLGGRIGKMWRAFVSPDVDVEEGDQIVATNNNNTASKRYSVRGVSTWEGAGLLDYRELILVSQDDDL